MCVLIVLYRNSFCDLPEITEDALEKEMQDKGVADDVGPFYKQYRCIFGWIAQTTYVYVRLPSTALEA